MSSSEEEPEIEPLPPNRIRFTDMPWSLVDKAIRRKCIPQVTAAPITQFLSILVVEKATQKCKIDKDLATEIQQ